MPERLDVHRQLRKLEGSRRMGPFSVNFSGVHSPNFQIVSGIFKPNTESPKYLYDVIDGELFYAINLHPNIYWFPKGYKRQPLKKFDSQYQVTFVPENLLVDVAQLGQNKEGLIDLKVQKKGNLRIINCSYPVNYPIDGINTSGRIRRIMPLSEFGNGYCWLADKEQEYLWGQEITEAYLKLFIRTWHRNRYQINDNADLLQGILLDKYSHFMASPGLGFARDLIFICLRKRDNMGLLLNEIMLGNDFITSKLNILGRGLPAGFSKNDLMDLTLQTRDALEDGDEDFLNRVLLTVGRIPGW